MIKIINFALTAMAVLLFTALVMAHNQASASQDRLASLQAELVRERGRVVTLEANVAHLEDPEQLRELARLHLGFEPVRSSQEIAIDELPRVDHESLTVRTDTPGNIDPSLVHQTGGGQP